MTEEASQAHPSRDSSEAHDQKYTGPDRRQAARRHPGNESASPFIEGIDQRTRHDRRTS